MQGFDILLKKVCLYDFPNNIFVYFGIKLSVFFSYRQVMERMTSQKLPARKMKVLFKKWIEVEEKLGDEEQVERIRQRAVEYVEKAKF